MKSVMCKYFHITQEDWPFRHNKSVCLLHIHIKNLEEEFNIYMDCEWHKPKSYSYNIFPKPSLGQYDDYHGDELSFIFALFTFIS